MSYETEGTILFLAIVQLAMAIVMYYTTRIIKSIERTVLKTLWMLEEVSKDEHV